MAAAVGVQALLVAAGVAVVELQYLAQEIINWLWLRAGVAVEQV